MKAEHVSQKEIAVDEIVAAKVAQASELLREFSLPLWIVQFARESYDHPQPVQELAVGCSVTWPAAFIVTAGGDAIAIVGTGDVANIESVGAYREVIGYVRDVGPPLREVLERFKPDRIGVSYALNDDGADNISHGMYLMLKGLLRDTPYAGRLVSADQVLIALRARKQAVEVDRIRASIESTGDLFKAIERELRPGVAEYQISDMVREIVKSQGMSMAWDRKYDPVVNFGPDSSFGHAGPGQITLEPGMLVHVDLGVKRNGYCSDLQRVWYLLRANEDEAPAEVQAPFDAVVRSMQAGFDVLRPGVAGWQVDAAARTVLTDAGYEEPAFALGHQLGQSTHDGGALLGPRWPRYGNRPEMPVEEGHVYTLEYALQSPAGIIGVEEDVLVTADGAEYLCPPQTQLHYVHE